MDQGQSEDIYYATQPRGSNRLMTDSSQHLPPASHPDQAGAKQSSTVRQHIFKLVITLLRVGIATALIIFLLRSGQLNFTLLATAQPQMLVAASFLQVAVIVFPLLRWHYLVCAKSFELRISESLHIGLIGNFLGIVVPSGIGADGTRAVYLSKRYPGHSAEAVSTVIVDRLLGLSSIILLGLTFSLLLMTQNENPVLNAAVVSTSLLAAGVIAVWIAALGPFSLRAANFSRSIPFVQRLITGVAAYKSSPSALLIGLLLSTAGHMSGFVAAYICFLAIGESVPFMQVLGITPLANLSAVIPLTPLGLGLSDSISAVLYTSQSQAHGADVNMLLRLLYLTMTVIGGLSFLIPVGTGDDVDSPAYRQQ